MQCNSDIDCPIGLICEKNGCKKSGPISKRIVKGIHTEFPKNLWYFWQVSLVLEKYLFDLTYTDFQKDCQKKPKSDFQFQNLNSSKSFWFFYYWKVIVYSNVFSLWLLFDNSQLTLFLKTPQVLLTYISGNEKSIQRADCKDKISTKKCKKLKKKGKCQDKKTWKKCMETCEKCTPGIVPLIMVINPKST